MGTRKINRKKNITQRKKYKKRGNKLLNTQKKIRKQSKNKKPVKKKQIFKIIKCPKCKGVKQLKISKKKLDKLRNAGLLTDDIYKALTGYFCCGDVFGTSSEKYDERDLHRGKPRRIQDNIDIRRSLQRSSQESNNSSRSGYLTANDGSYSSHSSLPSAPGLIKEEPSYILVDELPNREKQQFKYTEPTENTRPTERFEGNVYV